LDFLKWISNAIVGHIGIMLLLKDGGYVLPLLWMGIPVKVFCPVSQPKPEGEGLSSLCCYPNGMTVELRGPSAMKNTHINGKCSLRISKPLKIISLSFLILLVYRSIPLQ
ncbi:hypothetical protein GOODEAATRI_033725, partial [Goodea atripinnis]